MAAERIVRRVSGAAIHPFLAAAYPVIGLYAVNLGEAVPIGQLVLPLAVAIGSAAVVLGLLRLLVGDWPSAGLATTLLVALTFTYGAAWDAVQGWLPVGHLALLATWSILAGAGVALVGRLGRELAASLTPVLNLALAALLVGNLVAITRYHSAASADPGGAIGELPPSAAVESLDELPSIWWIILDRYGSRDVIDRYYDHDITPFLDALGERGFYVADRATANYLKTAPSLISSRNLDYLDGESLRARAGADDDWGPVYRDLPRSFRLLEVLRPLGYRFVYAGTYWQFTATHDEADINYVFDDGRVEFVAAVMDLTPLRAAELFGAAVPDTRREHWERTRHQWERLYDAIDLEGPSLVHAHFALPHAPYVFAADGSFVPEAVETARSNEEGYAEQVEYTNQAVLDFVDELLAASADRPPIIIIQADEGPWPHRYRMNEQGFRWIDDATDDELHEKFAILSAFHLPGLPADEAEAAGLYESITPVNQFRAILNHYLGTTYEMLPDRNFVWTSQEDLYTFVDITDRVRRLVDPADPSP